MCLPTEFKKREIVFRAKSRIGFAIVINVALHWERSTPKSKLRKNKIEK